MTRISPLLKGANLGDENFKAPRISVATTQMSNTSLAVALNMDKIRFQMSVEINRISYATEISFTEPSINQAH
jgi:hypothetical protein